MGAIEVEHKQALPPTAHEHLLRWLGLPQLEPLAVDGQDRSPLMEAAIQNVVRQCSDRDYSHSHLG